MVLIEKITINGVDYYIEHQAEDYYVNGGERPGHYCGEGAEALGLSGKVESQVFHNLSRGFSPDGLHQLRQQQRYTSVHAGCGKIRQVQAGWDVLFPLDKSISAAWAVCEEKRLGIDQAHLAATHAALKYLEDNAAYTRRGHGGTRRERVKLIIMVFPHFTARPTADDLPPNPHVHNHSVIMNCGLRSDGTFGSLDSRPLYEHQAAANAVFNATLAQGLGLMGFTCRLEGHAVKIEGIPDSLCSHWSQRNHIITERMDELGQNTPAQAKAIAHATRLAKGHVPPLGQLLDFWQTEATSLGITPQTFEELTHTKAQPAPGRSIEQIMESAADTLAATKDTFTAKDAIRHTLNASINSGVDPDTTIKATQERLRLGRPFVHVRQERTDAGSEHANTGPKQAHSRQRRAKARPEQAEAEPQYTTSRAKQRMFDIAERVGRLGLVPKFVLSDNAVKRAVSTYSQPRNPYLQEVKHHLSQLAKAALSRKTSRINRPLVRKQAAQTLDSEGRELVRKLTTRPGRIVAFTHAYTGQRELAIRVATAAWHRAGYKVIGCTPYRRAMEENTGSPAVTHRKMQMLLHPTISSQIRHHARQLVRAARKRPTYRLDSLRIDRSTVLVVDRADLLNLEELQQLTRDVERHGGKLVLLGSRIEDLPRTHPNRMTALLLYDLSRIAEIDPFTGQWHTHAQAQARDQARSHGQNMEM